MYRDRKKLSWSFTLHIIACRYTIKTNETLTHTFKCHKIYTYRELSLHSFFLKLNQELRLFCKTTRQHNIERSHQIENNEIKSSLLFHDDDGIQNIEFYLSALLENSIRRKVYVAHSRAMTKVFTFERDISCIMTTTLWENYHLNRFRTGWI